MNVSYVPFIIFRSWGHSGAWNRWRPCLHGASLQVGEPNQQLNIIIMSAGTSTLKKMFLKSLRCPVIVDSPQIQGALFLKVSPGTPNVFVSFFFLFVLTKYPLDRGRENCHQLRATSLKDLVLDSGENNRCIMLSVALSICFLGNELGHLL